jgi:hypothetical protein
MTPLIQFRTTILPMFVAFVVGGFALAPRARAVDPPPDGSYAGDNTAEGQNALFHLTTGGGNTAIGFEALFQNKDGSENTATGWEALFDNISGTYNTATGSRALTNNITGSGNTATGFQALTNNKTGDKNTATGRSALHYNETGINNTAAGYGALFNNKAGDNNTATGFQALYTNTEGIDNTANGLNALLNNKTGNDNTANGFEALLNNTTGNANTANGVGALYNNDSGTNNTASGRDALFNNVTGSENIAVGHGAGQNLTTGDNNIDIGNAGVAGEVGTIRIGHPGFFVEPNQFVPGQTATFIAGISGTPIGAGVAVRVKANGQLGTAPSSARFKQNIKPMDKASEAIHALKPVTFYYKKEVDPEGVPQFGLVAEDVEKVRPDLVARDAEGKVYTVRYEAVNAMLLNEFLKEHRKVERLEKQIEQLTAGLQKVSAEMEMSRAAPQVAENNR